METHLRKMSNLAQLPPELQLRIFMHCHKTELVRLSTTSRYICELCVPLLYQEVDLSSHRGDSIRTVLGDVVPADWASHRFNAQDDAVYRKQVCFVRNLCRSPALGTYVRVLRWTTVCMPDEVYNMEVDSLSRRCSEGVMSHRDFEEAMSNLEFNDGNDILWRTFSFLKNVRVVDLAFVGHLYREATAPPPLFQSAREVRLSGMASKLLIVSILDGLSSELEILSLNNLNQFAEQQGVDESVPGLNNGRMADVSSQLGAPGPMRGHLAPFLHKFQKLRHLEIHTVAQAAPAIGWGSTRTWNTETEDKRYEEIGLFIRNLSSTLESLTFHQGVTGIPSMDGWRRSTDLVSYRPSFAGKRPMDQRFDTFIYTAILDSNWPRLESLQLHGIASSSRPNERASSGPANGMVNFPLAEDNLAQIRAAVGFQTHLDITPEAKRVFWLADEAYGTGLFGEESDSNS
jgi:hypothetical protein